MVSSCMLVGGCRDRFLMRTPSRTLDRQRFGMRMVMMLLGLSASCVFPLRLYASLPWTHNWLFSLMSTSCLNLWPPAATTDVWFLPVQAVSSADPCSAFLEHHDHTFLLGACWRRLLWACKCLPSLWRGQPSAAAPEARWTLCWAGLLSWALLHSTHGLAIWCQGWSASSIGEIAPVAWSASDREPRSLHLTGGWERRWPCIPGALWRSGASGSAILSLTVFQRNCWLWTSGCQDPCWLWHHWRWLYPGKWSVPLHLGWCHQCWCEKECMPYMEGVGTTPQSSSGWWWGQSSWLHQRSDWWCTVRLPLYWQEGCSCQQEVSQ